MELLAPAGNFECLKMAVLAKADAVYIGGKMFGARAFSSNFSDEEIIEAINYCHLYGVKVYVTLNTLIREREVNKFIEFVSFLHKNNVDAIILQDLGMMDLVSQMFPNLEIHASTQMHVHNENGVKFFEKLGIKRVVLARETNIDTIKKISSSTTVDLEVFIHGSLCISYSGQCLMSSLIGNRSGNRGSCAGTCRLKYESIDDSGYLLSAKDLCTIDNIGSLIENGVYSFKIEGRMKSPLYVYYVTTLYRQAIDSYLKNKEVKYDNDLMYKLKKIFNREYTKGFLFNEMDIVNKERPNHLGVDLGTVLSYDNKYITIKLSDDLSLNDGIRIIQDEDIGFLVSEIIYNGSKVKEAYKGQTVKIRHNLEQDLKVLSKVSKTSDNLLNNSLNKLLEEKRKIPVVIKINALKGEKLFIEFCDGKNTVEIEGNIVEESISSPINIDKIISQVTKLGSSIYEVSKVEISAAKNIFISIKELNQLRRDLIEMLNKKRLYEITYEKSTYKRDVKNFEKSKNYNIYIKNIEQYNSIKKYDFNNIYLDYDNLLDIPNYKLKYPRVLNEKINIQNHSLIGEIGSLQANVNTDFSFNVTNSYTVAFLHSIGVNIITLSVELSNSQIQEIIEAYKNRYKSHPNLEVIIYGKIEAMISKYQVNGSYLIDKFKNKYFIYKTNDFMTIYNHETYKNNELFMLSKIGVNHFRINLLNENDYVNYIERLKW